MTARRSRKRRILGREIRTDDDRANAAAILQLRAACAAFGIPAGSDEELVTRLSERCLGLSRLCAVLMDRVQEDQHRAGRAPA